MFHVLRSISHAGETLIEAIVAISIFMYLVGPAAVLFTTSIRNTGVNRDDLVASEFANEGIEIVSNMRDTNFLRFSPKAQECWNTIPLHMTLNDCNDAAKKIGGGSGSHKFLLTLNPDNLKWDLEIPTGDLDLNNGNDSEYQLRLDSGQTGLYFLPPSGFIDPASPRGAPSPFYRQILLEYIDVDSDGTTDQVMRVVSRVQYRRGNNIRSIERVLLLTNQPS